MYLFYFFPISKFKGYAEIFPYSFISVIDKSSVKVKKEKIRYRIHEIIYIMLYCIHNTFYIVYMNGDRYFMRLLHGKTPVDFSATPSYTHLL